MNVIISRHNGFEENAKQSTGKLTVLNDDSEVVFECFTLELPWRNNERQISCIPTGIYRVEKRQAWESGSFDYEHFHITDVPARSYILIHAGNFYTDILGCILVGSDLKDINADGLKDVINSRETLSDLLNVLPETFEIEIRNAITA